VGSLHLYERKPNKNGPSDGNNGLWKEKSRAASEMGGGSIVNLPKAAGLFMIIKIGVVKRTGKNGRYVKDQREPDKNRSKRGGRDAVKAEKRGYHRKSKRPPISPRKKKKKVLIITIQGKKGWNLTS